MRQIIMLLILALVVLALADSKERLTQLQNNHKLVVNRIAELDKNRVELNELRLRIEGGIDILILEIKEDSLAAIKPDTTKKGKKNAK